MKGIGFSRLRRAAVALVLVGAAGTVAGGLRFRSGQGSGSVAVHAGGAAQDGAGARPWSIDELPADILSPLVDSANGGDSYAKLAMAEQDALVACLSRAGFPGFPALPVAPSLPRTMSELVKVRTTQGYGLVDYLYANTAYGRAVTDYQQSLGDRLAEFTAAYGRDYEQGEPDGCVAEARTVAQRLRRATSFPIPAARAMEVLSSFDSDPAQRRATAAYSRCVNDMTGLGLQPFGEVDAANKVMLKLDNLYLGGLSDADLRAEELRLAKIDLACFQDHLAGEFQAAGLRALAKVGIKPQKGSPLNP